MLIPIRVCLFLLAGVPSAVHGLSLQSGVVVDTNAQRVWLMHPDSAVEQVDIRNGKTDWRSSDGAFPVSFDDTAVLVLRDGAEPGTLAYALIDRVSGKQVAADELALPGSARALVEERLGERFELKAAVGGLSWTYRSQTVQGALMEEDESATKAASTTLQGAITVDWAQRRLQSVPDSAVKATTELAPEIGQPAANGPRTFRSASDRYRLKSERQEDGRYRWQILTAEGAPVGDMLSDYSYRPFEVVDGKLLYVRLLEVLAVAGQGQINAPTLVAYDLKAAKTVWTREIRDTEYRGPYPP